MHDARAIKRSAGAVGAARLPPHGEERVLDGVIDQIREGAPPRQPDGQPASVPVIQGRERILVAACHRAQQCRVIAFPSFRPHAGGRSATLMPSLSQQPACPVPIMLNSRA
jgi:hypothetical protein